MGILATARRAFRWTLVVVALFAGLLAGCNRCATLEERICGDLGSDCSVWQSDPVMRGLVISDDRRRRVREQTCEALGDEAVYQSRTLPMLRNYVARKRDPRVAPLPIPTGAPPSSGSGWFYSLLPFFGIAGVFGYVAYHRKFVMPRTLAQHHSSQNDAAAAQARALAEWQAQQAASRAADPNAGPGAGPGGRHG